ncbi:MAG: alkaline phosphatase family protein [Nanohaloarchaea archaeon]|nr:alkaline phosphatase family protein [Candidatus Nanohaloarchaea archaeon]
MSTDVVVFIDALSPRELEGFLEENYQGNMDADVPRVTPRVMSSIYTGLSPAENGMMSISKEGGEDATRPKKSTFIDQAVREGKKVLSMGMPFSVPFKIDSVEAEEFESLLQGGALQGESYTLPGQASDILNVPAPSADMIKDHPDTTYSSFLDQTRQFFLRAKENIRRDDFDVVFLGYRLVDSYCHFQHTEERNGKPYRQHLIDNVQSLLKEIDNQIDGDLMFFSDHGQTELTDTFRVNKWLKENGWLDYRVDYDFIDDLTKYQQGEKHPVNERVENQVTLNQPGVRLDEENSKVVCSDPFDSCLTLLCDREDFDEEKFREELMSTGMYRSVKYKWEIYDEDADFYETVPDIIPDRAEGVFVSGNLHKNPIGMGYYRTGVHDRTACFGATKKLNISDKEEIKPEDMYDVITDFIDLELTEPPLDEQDINGWNDEEVKLARKRLEGNKE